MSLLLKPFQSIVNTTLNLDLETKAKLINFDQKQIAISVLDLQQIIVIRFDNENIQLVSTSDTPADLTISGKSFDLAKLGSHPDNLFSAEIEIHGDVQFAKQLRDLVEGFDFDWEQELAKYTGDTLAYPIAHGIRKTTSWLKSNHESLQQTTAEYLREEIRILPDKSQINDYLSDIDSLTADYDRLSARVERLKGKQK